MANKPAYEDTAKRYVPKSKPPKQAPVYTTLTDWELALYRVLTVLSEGEQLDDLMHKLDDEDQDFADDLDAWFGARQTAEENKKREAIAIRAGLEHMTGEELKAVIAAAKELLELDEDQEESVRWPKSARSKK